MITIPSEFVVPIISILEWHLRAYMPETIFDGRVKRILDELRKADARKVAAIIEEKEIYFIHTCASDATNNIPSCGVGKDLVWRIHDWAFAEYKKTK